MTYLTAAFMGIGMQSNPRLNAALDHYGGGHVELTDQMVHYSDFCESLWTAGNAITDNVSGVWHYDVSEAFGHHWVYLTLAAPGSGVGPCHNDTKAALRQLAYKFFADGLPESTDLTPLCRALDSVYVEPA